MQCMQTKSPTRPCKPSSRCQHTVHSRHHQQTGLPPLLVGLQACSAATTAAAPTLSLPIFDIWFHAGQLVCPPCSLEQLSCSPSARARLAHPHQTGAPVSSTASPVKSADAACCLTTNFLANNLYRVVLFSELVCMIHKPQHALQSPLWLQQAYLPFCRLQQCHQSCSAPHAYCTCTRGVHRSILQPATSNMMSSACKHDRHRGCQRKTTWAFLQHCLTYVKHLLIAAAAGCHSTLCVCCRCCCCCCTHKCSGSGPVSWKPPSDNHRPVSLQQCSQRHLIGYMNHNTEKAYDPSSVVTGNLLKAKDSGSHSRVAVA